MKKIEEIKKTISQNKKLLEQVYKIKSIGIFGSSLTGQMHRDSDIDMLVEFSQTPDFFEFIRLEDFLGRLLHKKIDLVSKKALKPLIKDEILKEVVYL